jgi:hypothetical protein
MPGWRNKGKSFEASFGVLASFPFATKQEYASPCATKRSSSFFELGGMHAKIQTGHHALTRNLPKRPWQTMSDRLVTCLLVTMEPSHVFVQCGDILVKWRCIQKCMKIRSLGSQEVMLLLVALLLFDATLGFGQ